MIFGHAYGRMSRRRGEITGLMNESWSNSRLTIVRLSDGHRFFVTILIFFVFFLEASVSPKGASVIRLVPSPQLLLIKPRAGSEGCKYLTGESDGMKNSTGLFWKLGRKALANAWQLLPDEHINDPSATKCRFHDHASSGFGHRPSDHRRLGPNRVALQGREC